MSLTKKILNLFLGVFIGIFFSYGVMSFWGLENVIILFNLTIDTIIEVILVLIFLYLYFKENNFDELNWFILIIIFATGMTTIIRLWLQ